MNISITEIEKVAIMLLASLKKSKGDNIVVEKDLYWSIPVEELYDPYREPSEFTLGQLSDDLQEIKRLSVNPKDAVPYDLERLAMLIKILAVENSTAFLG